MSDSNDDKKTENKISATLFTTVPVDLFRMGNATGPRLDAVRLGKDVAVQEVVFPSGEKKIMVGPDGGMSTFDAKNPSLKGTWWKIPVGVTLPNTIRVTKDHGAWNAAAGRRITHYSFRPARLMTIEEYAEGLREVASHAVQEPRIINSSEEDENKKASQK